MAELDTLRSRLHELESVVVAFSGGADSAFLAWVANDTLGPDRVLAATAVSPSLAGEERDDCRKLADEWSLRWREIETTELEEVAYRVNDGDRCYWCKSSLMDALEPIAVATRGDGGARRQPRRSRRPSSRPARRGRARRGLPARRRRLHEGRRARVVEDSSACARGTSRPRPASRRGCRTERR